MKTFACFVLLLPTLVVSGLFEKQATQARSGAEGVSTEDVKAESSEKIGRTTPALTPIGKQKGKGGSGGGSGSKGSKCTSYRIYAKDREIFPKLTLFGDGFGVGVDGVPVYDSRTDKKVGEVYETYFFTGIGCVSTGSVNLKITKFGQSLEQITYQSTCSSLRNSITSGTGSFSGAKGSIGYVGRASKTFFDIDVC